MNCQFTKHYTRRLKPTFSLATIFFAGLFLTANVKAAETLSSSIQALEPIIGTYPPKINNATEADTIKQHYLEIKSELDSRLAADPDEIDTLFMRGHLQSLGHNMDMPNALSGADADLRHLLTIKPEHTEAALELAELWVNSNPTLAPNAEELFRAAQCYHRNQPLERAQRGIFFALYYQGKMNDALRQSEYLMQTWPQSIQYQQLNAMTRSVVARISGGKNTKPNSTVKLAMSSCN